MNDNIKASHHSHQQYYRSPFGAAAVLRTVRIRLRVEADTLPKRVALRLWKEKDGDQQLAMMTRIEAHGNVYETKSYVNKDIFYKEKDLMNYVKSNLHKLQYIEGMNPDKLKIVRFKFKVTYNTTYKAIQ